MPPRNWWLYVHKRFVAVMLALIMAFSLVGAQVPPSADAWPSSVLAGPSLDSSADAEASPASKQALPHVPLASTSAADGFADIAVAFPAQTPAGFSDLVRHTLHDGQIRAILALVDRSPATEAFVAQHTGALVFLGTTPHAIALLDAAGARDLLSSGFVTFLEPDQPLTHFMSESTVETNARSIDAAGSGIWSHNGAQLVSDHPSFQQPITGKGVTVSIVDSGIDRTHRDFGGWDCQWQPYQPCDSRIRFAGKTQVLPRAFLGGSLPDDLTATLTELYPESAAPTTEAASGHGTHVAGTIGGNARYTRDSGADVARYGQDGHNFGMAPEVDLVSISNGDSQWAGLGTAALAWTLDNAADFGIQVSSNSWGCLGGCSYNAGSSTSQIVEDLYNAGVVVTFAVGNDGGTSSGTRFSGYAQSPYVLGVANYDHHTGHLAASSSRGDEHNDDLPAPSTWDPDAEATGVGGGHRRPDVSAPGTSIWSARTLTGGTSSLIPRITTEDAVGGGTNGFVPYITMSGTSMATPHVSGAAALLFDACPDAGALDVMRAIMAGADTGRIQGNLEGYEQGYGALDVRASLDWMLDETDCSGDPVDTDSDTVLDHEDNCPEDANTDQSDVDGDGIGDVCDDDDTDGALGDSDGDGVRNEDDVCPQTADDQSDADGDGIGDACDGDHTDGPLGDSDGDGVKNEEDACEGHDDNADSDGNGVPDGCDAGATVSTSYYFRSPDDGVFITAVDQVTHGAGILSTDTPPDLGPSMGADNHALVSTTEPSTLADLVWQTQGAVALEGDVGIVVHAESTANPLHTMDCGGLAARLWVDDGGWRELTAAPVDLDLPAALPLDRFVLTGDLGTHSATGVIAVSVAANSLDCGAGITVLFDDVDFASRIEVSNPDSDGDGVPDAGDACPGFDDNADQDGDGTPDGCDDDRDGDGVADEDDTFPDDPAESQDADGDGVGDNSDGCPGFDDAYDHDSDGVPDGCDEDADDGDGDGIHSRQDNCPGHANAGQEDMDGDGRGSACDPDRDGDGYPNGREEVQGSDPDDGESVPQGSAPAEEPHDV